MADFVVDASVAVKWLIDEPYSEAAGRLVEGNRFLFAPELIYAEVANALWSAARRGDLGAADLLKAVDLMADAPLIVPAATRELMGAAVRLAQDIGHPVYDCIYLALALREQRPVITADRRFQNAVKDHPYLSELVVPLDGPD